MEVRSIATRDTVPKAKRALFSDIPSCRSVSALGADEFRTAELLGSEYSALPI